MYIEVYTLSLPIRSKIGEDQKSTLGPSAERYFYQVYNDTLIFIYIQVYTFMFIYIGIYIYMLLLDFVVHKDNNK